MRRSFVLRCARASLLVALLLGTASAQEADDVVTRAMRDELTRSMKELRLADLARPYFIAYKVTDGEMLSASAMEGSLLTSNAVRRRAFEVEVRVGDYAFDNTNFLDIPTMGFGGVGLVSAFGGHELPLDDDYLEIRRKLWLATDAAYKEAAENLAQKRAALLNRARRDTLHDFTKEQPTRTRETQRLLMPRLADAEALVRAVSGIRAPAGLSVVASDMNVMTTHTRYMNSEGTTYVTSRPGVAVMGHVSAQAADGTRLAAALKIYGRTLDSLPSREAIARDVQLLAARLDSLRAAPTLDRYAGPILFEREAAAELFAEVFAPALVARRPMSGDPQLEMFMRMTGRLGDSFSDKLGSRVMPEFMSVVDDPTLRVHGAAPLLGSYTVDEEGVPGRRKRVVEAGMLRSLLSTRTPVEGMPRSTGNRRGPTGAPSNVIVESSRGLSDRELRDQLLALVKRRGLPFGIVVRELGDGSAAMGEDMMVMVAAMRDEGESQRPVLRAYRLYPDGREELVRPGRLTGLDASAFRDIVAASRTTTVHHSEVDISFDFPIFFGGGFVAFPPAVSSYVVPSLLFEDASLTSPNRPTPTLPLVPPP
jgi:predicted Zn-dependent protease